MIEKENIVDKLPIFFPLRFFFKDNKKLTKDEINEKLDKLVDIIKKN